jgi:hypothetical protein
MAFHVHVEHSSVLKQDFTSAKKCRAIHLGRCRLEHLRLVSPVARSPHIVCHFRIVVTITCSVKYSNLSMPQREALEIQQNALEPTAFSLAFSAGLCDCATLTCFQQMITSNSSLRTRSRNDTSLEDEAGLDKGLENRHCNTRSRSLGVLSRQGYGTIRRTCRWM